MKFDVMQAGALSGNLGDIFWDLAPWMVYAPGNDLGCNVYVANNTETAKEYALMARLTRGTTIINDEAIPVFGAAWFKDVNAKTPTRYGPQPAPPGPVPTDWTAAPVGAGTTPQPAVAIGSSLPIGGVPADPGVGGAPARTGDGVGWIAPVVLIVGALVVIAILVARRRGRAPDDTP